MGVGVVTASVGAFYVSPATNSIRRDCFIYFLLLSFLVSPSMLFEIISSGRILCCHSAFPLPSSSVRKANSSTGSFLSCWSVLMVGWISFYSRETFWTASAAACPPLGPLLFRLCSHKSDYKSLSQLFLSHLPLSTDSLREEERVIKGGSSTFISSKFCFSLAIIFKDYCLFLYLRVADLFLVDYKFLLLLIWLRSGGWQVLGSLYLFIYLFIYNFYLLIYIWLRWVFVAVHGLSLVAASRGSSSLRCAGFSLQCLLLLQSTGCRHVDFSSCGMRAQ